MVGIVWEHPTVVDWIGCHCAHLPQFFSRFSSLTRHCLESMLLLAVLACLVGLGECVDRTKFQTCDSLGFCRRNRRLSNPDGTHKGLVGLRALPGTIRVSVDSFVVELDAGDGRALTLDVTGLASGVLRARFREKDALHRRYEVTDSLVPMTNAKLVYRPKRQTISVGKSSSLVLQFEPFQLDFYNGAEQHVIALNQRHLFNWEFYKTRPAEVVNDLDAEWDEKFGSHDDKKPRGASAVSMDATFVGASHVFGIPCHATNLSLPATRGSEKRYDDPFRMYNLDVFEYEMDNPMALYGHVPLMVAHSAAHTSALFWLNAAETWIDVDKTSAGPDKVATHWISESGIIDVFLLPGPTPKDVLTQYAGITGTPLLPPRFAIGYHQCKWNYKSEGEIAELDANFDLHNIPYDVSWLDIEHTDGKRYMTWDATHFPDPKRMINNVASKGRKMVTIVDPHLKRDNGYSVHSAASKGDHYIKDRSGNEYDGWCWPGSSSWPDFLSASVRDWWSGLFDYSVYQGSTSSLFVWNDMNEPSVFNGPEVTMHKDAQHHDGWEHRDVHNLYGMMVHAATHQGLLQRNRPAPNRTFVLSRALFAGTQRFGAIWTGDNAAEWSHLRASTPMVLSLALSGINFAGADVGGFFGNPDGELLSRWMQVGAMQPFFRGHAHLDSKRREPWVYAEPYLSAMRNAIRSRYAIMPYLYTLFHEASATGVPVMRPMWMEFPADASFFAEEDQFMLGSALLVRPVTQAGATSVPVRFPASSRWYRFDATLAVPSTAVEQEAPLERGVPVWLRGGSIVPRMERVRRSTHQQLHDPVTLVVGLDAAGEAAGEMYWDDGITLDNAAHHLHRAFRFAGGRLASSSAPGSSSSFESRIVVERIVVAGLAARPSIVTSGGKALETEWSDGNKVLSVRRPQLPLAQDWTVEFK